MSTILDLSAERPERQRPPIPLDAPAIAHHIELTYGIAVPAATIRKWAERGLVRRIVRDGKRNTFDLRSVLVHLRELGWIPPN